MLVHCLTPLFSQPGLGLTMAELRCSSANEYAVWLGGVGVQRHGQTLI